MLVWTLEDPSAVNEGALALSIEGVFVVKVWTRGVATETEGATETGAATEVEVTVVVATEVGWFKFLLQSAMLSRTDLASV